MLVTFIRTLIIFVTLVAVIRLLGKRQIGEMQPYEFVLTLIIADLACVPMADVSIPLVYGIVGILALFLFHQIISLIENTGDFCKKIVSGKPSLVINKSGVDIKELRKNNMGVEDLIEAVRESGYFSFEDVDYALFESNGKLSVLPKSQRNGTSVSIILISDGKENKNNLQKIMLTKQDLIDFLSLQHTTLKDTEVLTVDGKGRVYLKTKKQDYKVSQLELKEQVQW